jgi:hypothetical protein
MHLIVLHKLRGDFGADFVAREGEQMNSKAFALLVDVPGISGQKLLGGGAEKLAAL